MKASSPKAEPETQHVKQVRQRPGSGHGVSAGEAASRSTGFVDNRPGAVAQRQLQVRMDQSPRVQHPAEHQAMINTSPRQVVQRQQGAHMFGQAIHAPTEQTTGASRHEDRVQGGVAGSNRPLRQSMSPGSTGEVLQLAGTKPNQPSVDGRYRIKLSSDREKFTYENRVALGLDHVLPQHHPLSAYYRNKEGEVTAVELAADGTKVRLKVPIPQPSGNKQLLCIDTVGYQEPAAREEDDEGPAPAAARKLFMDIKIGHFTKSGEQFELEGANPFMLVFKKFEHDLKDLWRSSDELGYDIDAENLDKFADVHIKARSGEEPLLLPAMEAVWDPLAAIGRTMARAPVTFVGASVFIVLNLTEPGSSEVKIIDPDHPILLDTPPGLGAVPEDVMSGSKMQGGRNWNAYKAKWQQSFGSGMTNFLKWFAFRTRQLPRPQ